MLDARTTDTSPSSVVYTAATAERSMHTDASALDGRNRAELLPKSLFLLVTRDLW